MLEQLTNTKAFVLIPDFDDEDFLVRSISTMLSLPKSVSFEMIIPSF